MTCDVEGHYPVERVCATRPAVRVCVGCDLDCSWLLMCQSASRRTLVRPVHDHDYCHRHCGGASVLQPATHDVGPADGGATYYVHCVWPRLRRRTAWFGPVGDGWGVAFRGWIFTTRFTVTREVRFANDPTFPAIEWLDGLLAAGDLQKFFGAVPTWALPSLREQVRKWLPDGRM